MYFNIANRGGMCSTLTMTDIDWYKSPEQLAKHINSAIDYFNDPRTKRVEYCAWSDDHKEEYPINDGYDFKYYAFVVGTIIPYDEYEDEYDRTGEFQKIMEEWGAVFTEEAVHNTKNGTYVLLFHIPVKKLLKALEQYPSKTDKKEAA